MGELKQRGRVWWIRYYRNGRRYEESAKSERKGDAIRLLQLREGDSAKGLPVTPKIGRLTFDEAVADVVNDYRANGNRSIGEVERRIRLHLAPFFGGRRMASITTADLRAFIAKRQADTTSTRAAHDRRGAGGQLRRITAVTRPIAGAANAEINRELAIVKRAFRLALQAGSLLTMPHVPMLRENNVRQGFFEAKDFEDARARLPVELRGIVTFAYLTGWRIRSEVLTLQWAQVDRVKQTIRLEPGHTKSGEGRTVPYGSLPALVDVIDAQWREHERLRKAGQIVPWLIHRDGRPVSTIR